MEFNMNEKQQRALSALHDIYKFVRPGRTFTKSEMLDLLFAFVDKYENEFEEYVAGAYDYRMARMIDNHITREPE